MKFKAGMPFSCSLYLLYQQCIFNS